MHVPGAVQQGFIAHADSVHDQRVAFPGPNGVSVPGELKGIALRVLSSVREDLAHLGIFLIDDPDLPWDLEYLERRVQARRSRRKTVAAGIQFIADAWCRFAVIIEIKRIRIVFQSLRSPRR